MAKNKLRTIRVRGIDWKYRVAPLEVRLYIPNKKQILKRIPIYDVMNLDGAVYPQAMYDYIKNLFPC